jgi:hypothetical protein
MRQEDVRALLESRNAKLGPMTAKNIGSSESLGGAIDPGQGWASFACSVLFLSPHPPAFPTCLLPY